MKKIPKEAKNNGPGLEDRLYGVEDMPSPEESKLYMLPKGEMEGIVASARQYWNNIKPKETMDYVKLPFRSGIWYLWNLPPDLHEKLNNVLGLATKVAATKNPEAALIMGVAYGISKVVEGMKKNSGKDVAYGLVGISEEVKKLGKPEHAPIINEIEGILEKYFKKFDSSYSKQYAPA